MNSSRYGIRASLVVLGVHVIALPFGIAGCSAGADTPSDVDGAGGSGFPGVGGVTFASGGTSSIGGTTAVGSGGSSVVGHGGSPSNVGGIGGSIGNGGAVSMLTGAGGLVLGNGGNAGASNGGASGEGAGTGATAGAGGGASGNAGANSGGASPCSGGQTLKASDAAGGSGTPASGYAEVHFQLPTSAKPIVELRTTLIVPAKPTTSSTLFIWPGLEPLPGGTNYNPIGLGVLQPVLTWGTSCAPNSPKSPRGWWISSQYVNVSTREAAHSGCFGGSAINVELDDKLDITMSLKGTTWSQVVVDRQSGQMASYDIDMEGQAQDWALFKIEIPTQTKPASDIVFTSTTLTFGGSQPSLCQPTRRGANDYFSPPTVSVDGTTCCISRIVLRAQGVTATTPNMP